MKLLVRSESDKYLTIGKLSSLSISFDTLEIQRTEANTDNKVKYLRNNMRLRCCLNVT